MIFRYVGSRTGGNIEERELISYMECTRREDEVEKSFGSACLWYSSDDEVSLSVEHDSMVKKSVHARTGMLFRLALLGCT